MSSRIVGIKRQSEGMTVSSHEEETVCEDQEHERTKGRGGGKQRLKHVDGDVPLCMTKNDDECETEMKNKEKVKGKGGGRQVF